MFQDVVQKNRHHCENGLFFLNYNGALPLFSLNVKDVATKIILSGRLMVLTKDHIQNWCAHQNFVKKA